MWERASIHQLVREHLKDRLLVVVSNREPYSHSRSHGKIVLDRGGGGLIAILDAAMQATGGIWVAWGSGNADWEVTDQDGQIAVPPEKPAYLLRRVRLTAEEVERYYHGFSNRFCWPFFHGMIDRAKFLEQEWQAYQDVNVHFSDAILSEVRGKEAPIIWIQDYHLACVPRLVRERRPDATLSLFWHIPWPSEDLFTNMPSGKEFLRSLLCCDVLGFQTDINRNHFLETVQKELGAAVDFSNSCVTYRNQTTWAKTFAASIDTEEWIRMASYLRIEEEISRLRKHLGLSPMGLLGIGVDRLEYTKGLLERFDAIDLFLSENPQFFGRFTFVQIASPTRVMMAEYQDYQKAVFEKAQAINKKYCSNKWEPIVLYPFHVGTEELAVYYRAADLAIVSSVADGMNLVAKEFVASQIDERGVLLLSESAGASCEMRDALFINPSDIQGFAKQIKAALDMSPLVKKARMKTMREYLRTHNVYKWVGEQLIESCQRSPLPHARNHQAPI